MAVTLSDSLGKVKNVDIKWTEKDCAGNIKDCAGNLGHNWNSDGNNTHTRCQRQE